MGIPRSIIIKTSAVESFPPLQETTRSLGLSVTAGMLVISLITATPSLDFLRTRHFVRDDVERLLSNDLLARGLASAITIAWPLVS